MNYPIKMEQDQSCEVICANLPKTRVKINNDYETILKIKSAYVILLGKTDRKLEIQPNKTVKVLQRKESSNSNRSSKKRQGELGQLAGRLYRQNYYLSS